MRALLHHDFEDLIYNTSYLQIQFMHQHPWEPLFTRFDYTQAFGVPTTIHPTSMLPTMQPEEMKVEMPTRLARAARSSGKLAIHVVFVAEGRNHRLRLFPLRSSSTTFHDGLQRITSAIGDGTSFADAFPQVHDHLSGLLRERPRLGMVIH